MLGRALVLIALPLAGQSFEVRPNRILIDETASIRAAGLGANERVSIRAELIDGGNQRWSSRADFVADASGAIDTSKQAPAAGSYKEASAMGLVWSMLPEAKGTAHYLAHRNLAAQRIDFELRRGSGPPLQATLEQIVLSPLVDRIEVHDSGLRGILFAPRESGKHAGILVLGGSEGGLPAARAAWLANHGYAALALAYFHYEDLPEYLAAIPLEYFGRALSWMALRPEIDAARIGVVGGSRGGELALQLGSMYPRIRSVVAYVPANARHRAFPGNLSIPYAWTWQGRPLGFEGAHNASARVEDSLGAEIEVEHTQAPILLISGESDGVWESSSMAEAVVRRLKRHQYAFAVEHLRYAHAGHFAGRPEIVPAWLGPGRNPISGRETNPGGTPKGNAESSLDAIPRVLDFLHKSLSEPATKAQ